jgi:hypothetical protein
MPYEDMQFDPAIAFAPIVSHEATQPKEHKPLPDPWRDTFLTGVPPKRESFDVPLLPAGASPRPFRGRQGEGQFSLRRVHIPATEYGKHEK